MNIELIIKDLRQLEHEISQDLSSIQSAIRILAKQGPASTPDEPSKSDPIYDKSNLNQCEQDTGKKLSEKQNKDIIDQDLTTKSPSERFMFFHKTKKVADAPSTVAEKQDANKDKVTILCPVCKTPFEKKHAQKYCSTRCGQKVHQANYMSKQAGNKDPIKKIENHHAVAKQPSVDPPQEFYPDPEPSGEFDGPF